MAVIIPFRALPPGGPRGDERSPDFHLPDAGPQHSGNRRARGTLGVLHRGRQPARGGGTAPQLRAISGGLGNRCGEREARRRSFEDSHDDMGADAGE